MRQYAAPGQGEGSAHAVAEVLQSGPEGEEVSSYGYDDAGNMTRRSTADVDQTMSWDAEGHLATVSDGDTETSYLYDTNGERLIRRAGRETTLYLPGQEVTFREGQAADPGPAPLHPQEGESRVRYCLGCLTRLLFVLLIYAFATLADDVLLGEESPGHGLFLSLAHLLAMLVLAPVFLEMLHGERKLGARAWRRAAKGGGAGKDQDVRRAAGTQTVADTIRGKTGFPSGDDLFVLGLGTRLHVSAFAYVNGRFRQGVLELHLPSDSPVVWRPYRVFRDWGDPVSVAAPYQTVGERAPTVGESVKAGAGRRVLVVEAADRYWEFAVMEADVAVVRAALEGRGGGEK